MKDDKLSCLIHLAKQEAPPMPPEDFAATVMRQLPRSGESAARAEPLSAQFNALFPRLVFASSIAIGLCLGLDFALSSLNSADFSEQIAQASMQWLLP